MGRLTQRFSANRAVCEYTARHYLPAASAYRKRAAHNGAIGQQVRTWRHMLKQKWAAMRFGDVRLVTEGEQHVFEVQVYLGDLDPKAVLVELYAEGTAGGAPVRQTMKPVREMVGTSGGYVYGAAVSATRPSEDYTARVIPHWDDVSVPLESAQILWQR